ncbi:Bacterial regulatory protein, luxR family [compost metagenome]
MLALQGAEEMVREYGRGILKVTLDSLRALAFHALGRKSEAQERTRAALASGYRLGLMRSLLDEGDVFCRLLGELELDSDDLLDGYRNELLSGCDEPAALKPEVATAEEGGPALTRREHDILVLLGQSMSNKRIALALNLSLQTVKWNLKNVFTKLGVSSRYDAIIAGRKRGLLP